MHAFYLITTDAYTLHKERIFSGTSFAIHHFPPATPAANYQDVFCVYTIAIHLNVIILYFQKSYLSAMRLLRKRKI